MPMAIPLIAAGFEIYVGAGMLAAAGGALTAGAVVGGMMVAGGALTIVGTRMHDKDLTTFGSLLGLAGGVANMAGWADAANSASQYSLASGGPTEGLKMSPGSATTLAGETGSTIGTTANSGSLADDIARARATAAGAAAGAEVGAAVGPAAADSPMRSLLDGKPMSWADNTTGVGTDGLITDASGLAPGTSPAASAATSATSATSAGAPAAGVQPGAASPSDTYALRPTTTPTAAAGPGGQPGQGLPQGGQNNGLNTARRAPPKINPVARSTANGWSAFTDGIKGNKELAYLGGGLIQGAADSYSQQQNLANQQAYDQYRRDQYNASNTGLRAPRYVKPAPAPGG